MIETIFIKNFKSLKDTGEIALKPVTLLTGLNGMGKSSLIQTLLLLRQSSEIEHGILRLNNGLAKVGSSSDIRSVQAENDEVCFTIATNKKTFKWVFDCAKESDQIIDSNKEHHYGQAELEELPVFNNNFQYIASDRIAQQELHMASQSNIDQGFLGAKGEYAVHFLEAGQSKPDATHSIPDILRHGTFPKNGNIYTQTEAWLGEVSPGVRINISKITSDMFRLGFSFNGLIANPFKPANVGFGISYSLAVVVALLSSKPGSLIIIENPEAHLHPRGQAKLAELISNAARNGAQIILETHSDHILNGIRVMNRAFYDGTKNGLPEANRKGISNEEVAVYWFERNTEDFSTSVLPVHIEPNAKIKKAPAGFFDQMDFDLKKILGF